MAEAVTISHGDTLTGILRNKCGIQTHETYKWLGKLRVLNPHISNLNRIFPGESVLIPESFMETVPDARVWENAFKHIPRALEFPHNGHTQLFFTGPGVTIDSIAERMFSASRHQNMPLSTKRAVLIHNNPNLEQYIPGGRVPANQLVDITPLRLSRFDIRYWQGERPLYLSYLQNMEPMTRDMFQEVGPEDSYLLARLIETLREQGAAVGKEDVVKGIGYGVGGISGLAASGSMSVSNINALLQEMAADAVKKFGPKMATSKKVAHLTKMAQFFKSHPNYSKVMQQVRNLPELLLPGPRSKMLPPAAANVDAKALARYFRKGYYQSFRRLSSGRYMGPIVKQLNGRIGMFKALGRHATWYVPAVIGLYNVYEAPPETRMRTLFAEGFGVVGGALGTKAGVAVGLGIVALLGLGPFGLFLMVFVCASLGGIAGNEVGKGIGGAIYDFGSQLDYGQIYQSPEQLLEGLVCHP